eukprot:14973811-Alexandrium_andersonii.AAC.1
MESRGVVCPIESLPCTAGAPACSVPRTPIVGRAAAVRRLLTMPRPSTTAPVAVTRGRSSQKRACG